MRVRPLVLLTCCAALAMPVSVLAEAPPAQSAVVAQTRQQPVTFLDAWQVVLRESDALAAEQANIDRAMHLQDAAKDLYLPKITASANYTRLDSPVEIKPSDLLESMPAGDTLGPLLGQLGIAGKLDPLFTSQLTERDIFSSSIRAIWPIFTGGRISAAQDAASGKTQEAKYMLAMKQQAKFEDLSKFYFGVALTQQVLQTRIDVEAGLLEHFEHAKKLQQQGQIAKVERLQAEAAYDKARVERQKAERGLEIAQVALTKLLKLPQPATPSTALFTNVSLPPLDGFVQATLAGYPGLYILDAKKKQASALIDAEKGKYYPEVYLYGNYQLHEEDTLAAKTAPDWAVGVGVNIPLLDNSGRSGKVQAARSAVTQVTHLRAQAEQDLSVLVEKTYREALQSLEEYNGLASSLALAEENLRLRELAFNQGLSTSVDVVDAQLYIAGVRTQRAAAAYQYVISLSRLLAVSGNINQFKQYQQYQGVEVQS
ncbi:TolC family protein [Photobacterium aquae]|uniref:TolC family protein n=1 Tax=Photobacterium aquae TaxID=1195763 RepID=UPI00069D92B8|nr:TolC family protein [Photobacterium aquae]